MRAQYATWISTLRNTDAFARFVHAPLIYILESPLFSQINAGIVNVSCQFVQFVHATTTLANGPICG